MRRCLPVILGCLIAACSASKNNNSTDTNRNNNQSAPGVRARLVVSGLDVNAAKLATGPRLSVTAPTNMEYFGIGNHVGQAQVDGLRIRLTGVQLDDGNGGARARIADWNPAQELEVAHGFDGAVTGSGTIEPGTYTHAHVTLQSNFDVKAWAYLDRDHDGAVDTTLWTTASGVVTSASEIATTAGMAGYDYLHYDFLYPGRANTNDAMEDTPLPVPLVIASPATGTTDATEVRIDIRLDTYQIAQAWDGAAGTRTGVFSWDQGATQFHDGQPDFAIGYLPLFALVNDPAGIGETYAFGADPAFRYSEAQMATILFGSDGAPIVGRVRNAGDGAGLHLNQFLIAFHEETDGSLSFYADGGNGLYTGSTTAATDHVTGFRRLNVGDAPSAISVEPGPGCSSGCNARNGYVKRLAR
jgi:hypothetical protein